MALVNLQYSLITMKGVLHIYRHGIRATTNEEVKVNTSIGNSNAIIAKTVIISPSKKLPNKLYNTLLQNLYSLRNIKGL